MAGEQNNQPRRTTADGYGLRILNAIRRMIRAADLDSRQLAAHHQITAPQLVSLMAMVEGEPATAIEIAKRVHLGPSTLVGVIDRLEAKGLITRERDSQDRRQVRIRVTPEGRDLVAKTPFPLQYSLERAFGRMSVEERAQVAGNVERLVELMAVPEPDARPMLEIVALQNPDDQPMEK